MKSLLRLISMAIVMASLPVLHAQVPQIINYQGRVAVGTVNFNGPGSFKFALVDTAGTTTYWSNDGTSSGGNQPTAAVTLTVTKGLYSVLLGDTALANMTAIPNSVFNNADVRLRVWFNDGTNGTQLLSPDQRVAAVGYAMMAAGVNLPVTTSASVGVVSQDGVRLLHTFGTDNFFAGAQAGNFTMTGFSNTVIGEQVLLNNTTGFSNTVTGYGALLSNTEGSNNTASGVSALALNMTGGANVAVGLQALYYNTTGHYNTAVGGYAGHNINGTYNVALGYQAGNFITAGARNIAIGYLAGSAITTGSNNIDIGNDGFGNESNAIRIGTVGTHNKAVVAGIFGVTVGGSAPVIVNANGLLGTVSSSRRFKTEIADMDSASEALLRLRPVTFLYQPELDDTGSRNFGLIAEEVAEVDPDLVLRDARGEIYTVRYEAVNAMLLNEFLKERQRTADVEDDLRTENASLEKRLAELEAKDKERDAREKAGEERLAKLEQLLPHASPSSVARAADQLQTP